jgi:hypothetical protein
VHVHVGELRFDRHEHVPIRERVHVGVDAALHADLGGAAGDRFLDLAEDHVHAVRVRVGLPALALERAELAVHEADVREVDVPVDDVGDVVADVLAPDGVGRAHDRDEVVALGAEERFGLVGREVAMPAEHAVERLAHAGRARPSARSTGSSFDATASIAFQSSNQLMWDVPPS